MHVNQSAPSPFAPKLDLRDAVEIRRAHAAGVSARDLAAAYGLAKSSVHEVLRGRAHVCTVTVRLNDPIYLRLADVAASEGVAFEDVVLRFIVRALSTEGRT